MDVLCRMVRFRALHTRALCVHGCCIDRVTTSPFVHKDVGMRPAAPYPLPCPVVVGTLLTAISAASAAVDRPLCTLRRQHSTHNSLDWRKDAMRSVRDECERAASTRAYDCGDRDVYEFGVYGGKSIKSLLFYFNCSGIPLRRFWAFDSFRGLPDEDRRNFSAGVERMYTTRLVQSHRARRRSRRRKRPQRSQSGIIAAACPASRVLPRQAIRERAGAIATTVSDL